MGCFHLAQINMGKTRAKLDSVRMRGFVSRFDEINALAERSPGFIWRLQTDEGITTGPRISDNSRMIITMSVWESIDALQDFVYQSAHAELLGLRNRWFEKSTESHQALWWILAEQIPTIEAGINKLFLLERDGPSRAAFTFARPFAPEEY